MSYLMHTLSNLTMPQALALSAVILAPAAWYAHQKINKPWQNHLLALVVASALAGAAVTLIPR